MNWMRSSTFFKVISHLIEGVIIEKNCPFLISQNGQVITDNYKRKSRQVIREGGSIRYFCPPRLEQTRARSTHFMSLGTLLRRKDSTFS